ncbi:MAG TPA: nucleoside deaminase [Myxococcota bacterium]|nr:nucleoside deaminase [Myxococcota bacterium]
MSEEQKFMGEALALARLSANLGEVPVGALVVVNGKIVGKGYNRREYMHSALEHAELMAIKEASKHLGRWRLSDATVYTTLEPCLMCTGALLHARIKKLIFGARDPKFGAIVSLFNLADDQRLNHRFSYEEGVMAHESKELLQRFFAELRRS